MIQISTHPSLQKKSIHGTDFYVQPRLSTCFPHLQGQFKVQVFSNCPFWLPKHIGLLHVEFYFSTYIDVYPSINCLYHAKEYIPQMCWNFIAFLQNVSYEIPWQTPPNHHPTLPPSLIRLLSASLACKEATSAEASFRCALDQGEVHHIASERAPKCREW